MALDWEAIKTEYITTETSLSKLAKKYGTTKQIIGRKSSSEKWVEQRRRYVDETLTKTLRKHQERDVNRLCKLMDATEKLIDISLRAINDEQQYNRFIVSEGIGDGMSETSEKVFDKVDTRALKDTVSVLKDLTALARDFYDIPTAAQREQRDINRERLEIEKKRAEQGEASGNITIIVPKDAEGLDE